MPLPRARPARVPSRETTANRVTTSAPTPMSRKPWPVDSTSKRMPTMAATSNTAASQKITPRTEAAGPPRALSVFIGFSTGARGHEVEGYRVQAVAQSGGGRAIVEYVAEVAAAAGTGDLGAHHAVAEVSGLGDIFLYRRGVEARPAATGVEFGAGVEQQVAAAHAEVLPRPILAVVDAGEGTLGALLAAHRVLLGGQSGAPVIVALVTPIVAHGSSAASRGRGQQSHSARGFSATMA